jgi:hypothetical protein
MRELYIIYIGFDVVVEVGWVFPNKNVDSIIPIKKSKLKGLSMILKILGDSFK